MNHSRTKDVTVTVFYDVILCARCSKETPAPLIPTVANKPGASHAEIWVNVSPTLEGWAQIQPRLSEEPTLRKPCTYLCPECAEAVL